MTVVRVAEGQQEHIVLHAYKCKDRKKVRVNVAADKTYTPLSILMSTIGILASLERWYLQESQTAQAQEAAGLLNRICQTIQATARVCFLCHSIPVTILPITIHVALRLSFTQLQLPSAQSAVR